MWLRRSHSSDHICLPRPIDILRRMKRCHRPDFFHYHATLCCSFLKIAPPHEFTVLHTTVRFISDFPSSSPLARLVYSEFRVSTI